MWNFVQDKKDEPTIEDKLDLMTNLNKDRDILLNKITNLFAYQNKSDIFINESVYRDLDIFNNNNNDIFQKIDHTNTLYGNSILENWIKTPTKDTNLLVRRQDNIKKLVNNKEQREALMVRLENMKDSESNILWFWDETTEEVQSLYDIVYFNFPFLDSFLNNNELILNISSIYKIFISPSITILTPIVTFLIPYIFILLFTKQQIPFKHFFRMVIDGIKNSNRLINILGIGNKAKYFTIFTTGLWVFFYIQSAYNTVRSSIDTNKIINILHRKINHVSAIVHNVVELKYLVQDLKIDCEIDEELGYFNNLLGDKIFDRNGSLFENKGRILYCYKCFLANKEKLVNILKYIGEIDTYLSISTLYLKNIHKKNKYCFAKYSESKKPVYKAKKIWHPYLETGAVTNDIAMLNKNRNLLITGPNKAGKSTFIKSLALVLLFSQTIGIASAKELTITPFSIINTYLHIPDSIGYESLFEAEMYRARDHINLLKQTNNDNFAFIIMDEIFTSTNYVEGYAAAYAVIKKLADYKNSISIITTHFTTIYKNLNKLEKETGGMIRNYKFCIERDNNNNILYPYKLKRGISKQYIALELLKKNKFDVDIINLAIKICRELEKKCV